MHGKTRLGFGAGVAAVGVLALAGCSGSGAGSSNNGENGSSDAAAIALVSDVMNKADSAGTVKVAASGVVDGRNTAMTADEQFDPLELSMSTQTDGQNVSVVLIGQTFYMDYPALSAMMDGKQWAEVDLAQAKGALGSFGSLIGAAQNQNPGAVVSALLTSNDVTKVGTATVQGQQTTHYSGVVQADQLFQSDHLSAAQLAAVKSALQNQGISKETIDLWVASDGLPVQVRTQAQTAAGPADLTSVFSGWGAPVQVGAPPADQVFDMTAQLNAAQAGASAKP